SRGILRHAEEALRHRARTPSDKRGESDEEGPAARWRPSGALEAYSLYVERATEGANEAGGPLSSLSLLLVELGPGIPKRDRPVPHEVAGRGVARVGAEIAVAFELVGRAWCGGDQARLELTPGQPLQRLRIEVLLPITVF